MPSYNFIAWVQTSTRLPISLSPTKDGMPLDIEVNIVPSVGHRNGTSRRVLEVSCRDLGNGVREITVYDCDRDKTIWRQAYGANSGRLETERGNIV